MNIPSSAANQVAWKALFTGSVCNILTYYEIIKKIKN